MTDTPDSPPADPPAADPLPGEPPPTEVVRRRRWNLSLVWLVPAVAVAIGASLLVRTFVIAGPRLEVEFASADGVEAGKTVVRYKEVVIGKVTTVTLRGDRKRVVVGIQLDRTAKSFAVEDTRFWVVRPRIGANGISGLSTLLSGAYIAADAGVESAERKDFTGLEQPPLVLRGEPGAIFILHSDDLGSLDVGSPVFHKRARVGRVVGYTLEPERDQLSVSVFVEAPYQKLVTHDTRFWNASGIDFTLNASGLTVNAQTLTSVIAGGLAFDSPPDSTDHRPAIENELFVLYDDRHSALAPPDGPAVPVRLVFDSSVRGLSENAVIDLLGIEIGRVRSVALNYDSQRRRFPVEVKAEIFPLRLGPVRTALLRDQPAGSAGDAAVLARLAASGLRAQLRSGNLITGQLYVALDFIDKPGRPAVMSADGYLDFPTAPGTLSELQPRIASIVEKVSKIPFDQIGQDLHTTLSKANATIDALTPEAREALADVRRTLVKAQSALESLDRNVLDANAPVQHNLDATLTELQRASRSLRVLSDYLQQHPESLLRGKPADQPVSGR